MKSAVQRFGAWLLALGLFFTPLAATAQTYTATLTGTVADPQGAAVKDAKVVATNAGTKLEYTARSSDSGT